MVMLKQVGEVFGMARGAEDIEDKKAILRKNDTKPLREVIRLSFGLDPFTALTKTEFKYKPAQVPYPYNDAKLISAARMFRVYRGPKNERITKRFQGLLESLHADEAVVLLDAVNQRLDVGLNASQYLDALPGLFAEGELAPKVVVTRFFVDADGNLFRDDVDDMKLVTQKLTEIDESAYEMAQAHMAEEIEKLPEAEETETSEETESSEKPADGEDKGTITPPEKGSEKSAETTEKKSRRGQRKKNTPPSIFGDA